MRAVEVAKLRCRTLRLTTFTAKGSRACRHRRKLAELFARIRSGSICKNCHYNDPALVFAVCGLAIREPFSFSGKHLAGSRYLYHPFSCFWPGLCLEKYSLFCSIRLSFYGLYSHFLCWSCKSKFRCRALRILAKPRHTPWHNPGKYKVEIPTRAIGIGKFNYTYTWLSRHRYKRRYDVHPLP